MSCNNILLNTIFKKYNLLIIIFIIYFNYYYHHYLILLLLSLTLLSHNIILSYTIFKKIINLLLSSLLLPLLTYLLTYCVLSTDHPYTILRKKNSKAFPLFPQPNREREKHTKQIYPPPFFFHSILQLYPLYNTIPILY